MKDTPLPLVVCAMMIVGRAWILAGGVQRFEHLAQVVAVDLQHGPVEQRDVSISGSSGMMSCTAPSNCTSL